MEPKFDKYKNPGSFDKTQQPKPITTTTVSHRPIANISSLKELH